MIYVFDTSSIRALQHFFPTIFQSVWAGIDRLVAEGRLISTREVFNELENQDISDALWGWVRANKALFQTPTAEELEFVAHIFSIPHFQSLIGAKQRLRGSPVADPFVIALARISKGTVVTEERYKKNSAKIPNVCEHFSIPVMNLESFMAEQEWKF